MVAPKKCALLRVRPHPCLTAGALLLILTCNANGNGAAIYSQAPVPLSTGSYWVSDDTNNFYPNISFRVFDGFTLAQNSLISELTWRGAYWDEINRQNNPVLPDTVSWDVGIFSDTTGEPNSAYVSQTFSLSDVSLTFVGLSEFRGDSISMYDFRVELSSPFIATAGVDYWFSPRSLSSTREVVFLWSEGVGGDGISTQTNLASNESFTRPGDRAFQILGTAVPEPTAALFLGCTGALACLRRRRR